ncbi:MAG TPA: hypothetical protein VLJ79_08100 [Candidatus Binatia bacterium]|nr:hypothetical protein [Candidatus Binatia bacterium]
MLAKTESLTRGLSDLPLVKLPHPVGSVSLDILRSLAESNIDSIVNGLTAGEVGADFPLDETNGSGVECTATVEVPAEPGLMFQYFINRGWSDGLPMLPPTEAAIDAMIAGSDLKKGELLGVIPPLNGIATVERVAANAVMAGCLPDYFPLLVASVKGVLQPGFNLDGVQTTTGNVAPLVIVNGPCRNTLQINYSSNVLGQGWRANSTIGRALRLVVSNIGGAVPGIYDKATLGQPAKYTFCIAENEEENPWKPLHVERGFTADTDVVSVFGCTGVHSAVDMASQTAKGLLKTFALTMMGGLTSGVTSTETMLIICPEHAAILSVGGYSKAAIRNELFVAARVPHEKISDENLELLTKRRPIWFQGNGGKEIGVVDRPEDIWIVVAGGKGAKSAYIPGRTGTHLQTTAVADNSAAISCNCS